ncbi:hypoxanthine-guanine phosphoribosyltransferase [Methylomonas sp. MgM2]
MLNEIEQVKRDAMLLYPEAEVEAALDRMAAAINVKLAGQNPLVLCVINGGIITTGKLLPRLDIALTLDSIHASRYRNSTTGGDIRWLATPTASLANRNVLIVDDILDEGYTMAAITDWCRAHGAVSVNIATLLDKDLGCDKPISADFVGLTVPNRYLFGYGLDYKGYLRNMAGIYACKEIL